MIAYPEPVRWLALVVLLAVPAIAVAKPKVAVAHLDDDDDDKVGTAVAEIAAKTAKVTGLDKTAHAMDKLGIATLSSKEARKLRGDLEVDVVIHGKVEHEGSKRQVELILSGRGKSKATLHIEFKTLKELYKELKAELAKKIDEANESANDDDPDAEEAPKKKLTDDDPQPKKLTDDNVPRPKKNDDDDRPKKKDDDERPKKRVAAEEAVHKRSGDDDEDHHHRKHKHHEVERNALTEAAAWLDVGASVTRRTLTYDAIGSTPPPPVGTGAAGGQIYGEVYPWSFNGTGAGFGFAGDFAKTVGLGISVPGSTVTSSINDGHYSIGARYRFVFGTSSIAVGASYWSRYYIADRSQIVMPAALDLPDVDYAGIAPVVMARIAATPTIAAFVSVDVPLILKTGAIGTAADYGRGTAIAFDVDAGVQITLGEHYAVKLTADFDQVGISYASVPNSPATTRDISAVTDRSIALAASIGVMY